MASVIVVHGGEAPDPELVAAVNACATARFARTTDQVLALIATSPPDAVLVEVGDDDLVLGDLSARLPDSIRLIAIGDPRSVALVAAPDCVLLQQPDEETLRGVLTLPAPVDPEQIIGELLTASVFGHDLPSTLQGLAMRFARAFGADDCVILLLQEATCYTAQPLSDDVVAMLAPLCETVCQFGTTVIAPERPGRPYRAFLGLPLSHDDAPLALLLLCRENPVPFARNAQPYLRGIVERLSADLSWRLIHERLLEDREKLRELSRIDPVLGVSNRTALQEELPRQVAASERRGEPFCVAVIDVDSLRLINERNGYPAGDAVLAHVAQVARMETRAQDIVARYVGGSVAVVMPGAAPNDANMVVTRILSAIDAIPVLHDDAPINLTVSAGIAELHYDVDTGEAALARAMAARERAHIHGEVIGMADETVAEVLTQPDFQIGNTLGGAYQIRHEISRGAFGVVYRAEDLALGRQVALKLLRPDLASDAVFVEGFRKEAATLARIRDPNLVQVYAFGVEGTNVFFAMELVEGQGLDKRIFSARKRKRHLLLTEVVGIIDQVANALEAVHRAGMLHRDVKPENVLIDRTHRRYVLVDVGIAVQRGEKNAAGTPGFTAPEVFGQGSEAPATDVYSLGALAYMLLTLTAPYGDGTPLAILTAQTQRRPMPLTDLRRDLPPEVNGVVLAAMDPDPAKRPQTAREFARAFSEILAKPEVAPRQTVERLVERSEPVRRVIQGHHSSNRVSPSQPPSIPSTRGVLFRSAYEVLGARRGSAWAGEAARRFPELAPALAPQASPLAWYPTTTFISLLESLAPEEAARRTLATHLGRTAVDLSFGQFYGADPTAVTPSDVLRTADMFLRQYHSWGAALVTARETDAVITLTSSIASAILCACTEGLLAGVVARSGGGYVGVEHKACVSKGAAQCVFDVMWREATIEGDSRTLMG